MAIAKAKPRHAAPPLIASHVPPTVTVAGWAWDTPFKDIYPG